MNKKEKYDYVVIGSGINALLTSALLANSGKKVCILEKHYLAGGYSQSFDRGGYKFCAGLHYVFNSLPHEDGGVFLREVGLDKEITFIPFNDNFDKIDLAGMTYNVRRGAKKNIAALSKLFPDCRKGLEKYYQIITKIYNEAFQMPIDLCLASFLSHPFKYRTLLRYRNMTTQQLFDKLKFPQKLQCILSGQCGNVALAPEESSIITQALNVMSYDQGACYPTKSFYHMINTIADFIRAKGSEIKLKHEVIRLGIKDGKIAYAETAKGKFYADNFIFNADPKLIVKLVGKKNVPSYFLKKLDYEYSSSSFTWYIGLKGIDLREYGFGDWCRWYYPTNNINKIYRKLMKGDMSEPFLFISTPTLHGQVRKFIAPKGGEQFIACTDSGYNQMKKIKASKKAYYKEKERITNIMLDIIEQNYIPKFRKYISVMELGTPTTNEDFVNSPYGNIYGAALTNKHVNIGKINSKTPFGNLFLANATSGMPGLGGAFRGSLHLYSKLTRNKRIWKELYSKKRVESKD